MSAGEARPCAPDPAPVSTGEPTNWTSAASTHMSVGSSPARQAWGAAPGSVEGAGPAGKGSVLGFSKDACLFGRAARPAARADMASQADDAKRLLRRPEGSAMRHAHG
jgi:hypothetical protein